MGERRRSLRRSRFLRGCVYFDKRRSALDCLVCDISDQGARILLSENVSFPELLELYIPQNKKTHRAVVRWRHGAEIGLCFPDNIPSDSLPGVEELIDRESLEAENPTPARMLRRLKQTFSGLLIKGKVPAIK